MKATKGLKLLGSMLLAMLACDSPSSGQYIEVAKLMRAETVDSKEDFKKFFDEFYIRFGEAFSAWIQESQILTKLERDEFVLIMLSDPAKDDHKEPCIKIMLLEKAPEDGSPAIGEIVFHLILVNPEEVLPKSPEKLDTRTAAKRAVMSVAQAIMRTTKKLFLATAPPKQFSGGALFLSS